MFSKLHTSFLVRTYKEIYRTKTSHCICNHNTTTKNNKEQQTATIKYIKCVSFAQVPYMHAVLQSPTKSKKTQTKQEECKHLIYCRFSWFCNCSSPTHATVSAISCLINRILDKVTPKSTWHALTIHDECHKGVLFDNKLSRHLFCVALLLFIGINIYGSEEQSGLASLCLDWMYKG